MRRRLQPAAAAAARGLDALLAVVWAPRCAACGDPLAAPTQGVVCPACWRDLPRLRPPVCDRCGAATDPRGGAGPDRCAACRAAGGPITPRRAGGVHAGPLRAVIHAFKYGGRRSLARPLGRLMRDTGGDWLADADLVVPVPLHPLRRWRRGFNQAADLADTLGRPVAEALRRRRHTAPQVAQPRARRLRALHGAFALRRGPGSRPPPAVAGRSILIVDDVITTGATIEACAAVLRQAGAREVRAISAALAAPGGRSDPAG